MSKLVPIVAFAAAIGLAGALAAEKPDQPKTPLICRAAKQSLGSHIRTPRRCRTAEQWAAEDEAAGRIPISLQVNQSKNDGTQRRSQ
jgi:hypothetical protein